MHPDRNEKQSQKMIRTQRGLSQFVFWVAVVTISTLHETALGQNTPLICPPNIDLESQREFADEANNCFDAVARCGDLQFCFGIMSSHRRRAHANCCDQFPSCVAMQSTLSDATKLRGVSVADLVFSVCALLSTILNSIAIFKWLDRHIKYSTLLIVFMEIVQVVLCCVILAVLGQNDSIAFTDDLIQSSCFKNPGDESAINDLNSKLRSFRIVSIFELIIGLLLICLHASWFLPGQRDDDAKLVAFVIGVLLEIAEVVLAAVSLFVFLLPAIEGFRELHAAVGTIDSTRPCVPATCTVQALLPSRNTIPDPPFGNITSGPTRSPIRFPTNKPAGSPAPFGNLTSGLTRSPVAVLSGATQTRNPTTLPTSVPTEKPAGFPSSVSTAATQTSIPTTSPVRVPTENPTILQTEAPIKKPTKTPTKVPISTPAARGVPCDRDSDCPSSDCAYASISELTTQTCCPPGVRSTYVGSPVSKDVCRDQATGSFCQQTDSLCASGACFQGICLTEKLEEGAECDSRGDCINGVCALPNIGASRPICCHSKDSNYISSPVSNNVCTGQPVENRCQDSDSLCASGVCVNGICLETRQPNGHDCDTSSDCESSVCTAGTCLAGPSATGEICDQGSNCLNGVCAYASLSDLTEPVCCPPGVLSTYVRSPVSGNVCRDQATESFCQQTDSLCTSGACFQGICLAEKLEGGEECDSHGDCVNGVCALPNIGAPRPICCLSGASNYISRPVSNNICTGQATDKPCQDSDGLCESRVCVDGFCLQARQADGEVCDTNSDCESSACTSGLCLSGRSAALEICDVNDDCLNGVSVCAQKSLAELGALVCCPPGVRSTYVGSPVSSSVCRDQASGSPCQRTDALCASGVCSDGVCR